MGRFDDLDVIQLKHVIFVQLHEHRYLTQITHAHIIERHSHHDENPIAVTVFDRLATDCVVDLQ